MMFLNLSVKTVYLVKKYGKPNKKIKTRMKRKFLLFKYLFILINCSISSACIRLFHLEVIPSTNKTITFKISE